jgi:hypothetical protein
MKQLFFGLALSLVWIAMCVVSVMAKADQPQDARQTANPNDSRSYTQGYMPYLGGAYRNPDAYLPYYQGYSPYWQAAPIYPYPYPLVNYSYPVYPPPFYAPANQIYRPRPGYRAVK